MEEEEGGRSIKFSPGRPSWLAFAIQLAGRELRAESCEERAASLWRKIDICAEWALSSSGLLTSVWP